MPIAGLAKSTADIRYLNPNKAVPGGALGALRAALDGISSASLIVCGDSTGNEASEWVKLLADDLALDWPNFCVRYRLWDDANTRWDVPTILGGSERYILNGTSPTMMASLPHASFTAISGDLDLRAKVDFDAWTGTTQGIVAKWGNGGDRAWQFGLATTGVLSFSCSTDGTTTAHTMLSTSSAAGTPGTAKWVRVTHDHDNGAAGHDVKFYTSADGVTWTQLGSTVTTATAFPGYFANTRPYEIGGRTTSANWMAGKIYVIDIRNGIDGPSMAPLQIDSWNLSGGSYQGNPMFDVYNASVSGQQIPYFTNAARKAEILRPCKAAAVLISLGHNHNTEDGAIWEASLDSMLTELQTYQPRAAHVFLTQSPQVLPGVAGMAMARRRLATIAWCHNNACACIDTYRAFLSSPGVVDTSLINADGVHPLTTGSEAWFRVVDSALFGSR